MKKSEMKNLTVVFILRYFSFILFFVVVVIFVLGWFLFVGPEYEQMKRIGSLDYLEKLNDYQEKQGELAALKALEQDYQELNFTEVRKLSQVLPPVEDLINIYGQMDGLAKELGLDLTSISISPEASQMAEAETTSGVGVANISVNLSSIETYSALKGFLEEIEKNIRLLDLSSFSYSPNTNAYSLSFTTYYYLAN